MVSLPICKFVIPSSIRELIQLTEYPSLQTRGADFGDGSVYITYRNVRSTARQD